MTSRLILLCLLATTVDFSRFVFSAEPAPSDGQWDCGTFALYHLLRLEGRPAELNRLRATLGASSPEGHSFRELREAAARFRSAVDAVVLPKQRSAIRGPTLIFLKDGSEGHFVVVRPVGHTGHLIQLLDGEKTPDVLDAERLFASRYWTGLALVPHRTNYFGLSTAGISGCCMIAFGFRTWKRRRRRSDLVVIGTGLGGGLDPREGTEADGGRHPVTGQD
jgi:uncharacterized iron-regulated membrane protein